MCWCGVAGSLDSMRMLLRSRIVTVQLISAAAMQRGNQLGKSSVVISSNMDRVIQ